MIKGLAKMIILGAIGGLGLVSSVIVSVAAFEEFEALMDEFGKFIDQ